MNVSFEWDAGNIQHVVHDYPERQNTIEDVESLFSDPYFVGDFDRLDPKTGEPRYWGMGMGTQQVVKYVVYVVRNGHIRPVTCHKAKRNQRTFYHEQADARRSQET